MKKMIDVISGKEKINVAEVNTSLIKSNATKLISHLNYVTNIGDASTDEVNIGATEDITLSTSFGSISINEDGIVFEGVPTAIQFDSLIRLPSYATAQRPTPYGSGSMLFDTTLGKCIIWNGTAWVNLDGTALS